MVIKNSKEVEKKAKIEVRKGEIGETKEYKCLGDFYDKMGNNEIKIKKKMERAKFMAFETKRRGAYTTVGSANMAVQLLLLDMTVKSTLLSNTETWCEITKKEEEMITSYHHQILCIIFGQPRSTPYYGIVGETGIWPYKFVVVYKKLMFLHHVIHSSDERIAKLMVQRQQQMMREEKNNTWYAELYHKVKPMNIDIQIKEVEKKKKSSWKSEVKEKICQEIEKELQEQARQKTKLP